MIEHLIFRALAWIRPNQSNIRALQEYEGAMGLRNRPRVLPLSSYRIRPKDGVVVVEWNPKGHGLSGRSTQPTLGL